MHVDAVSTLMLLLLAPVSSWTSRYQCGAVPWTCTVDLSWAVSTGSQNNPEWYPDFFDITGVALSDTTIEDMALYWVCTGYTAAGSCDALELPCGRSCGDDTCGSIPATCAGHLSFAVTYSKRYPERFATLMTSRGYPDFYDITGVALSDTASDDMALYWVCTGYTARILCDALEMPCSRSCMSNNEANVVDVTDYIGFDVSVGFQANQLTQGEIAYVTTSMRGVKLYKFYGWSRDAGDAAAILAASRFPDDLKFYIGIPAHDVSLLSKSDIAALLAEWEAMKANVFCIAMGNEPVIYDGGATFGVLPEKLEMMYDYLADAEGWEHVKVSIPFSQNIVAKSYPVDESYFKSEYATHLTQIVSTLQRYGGPFSINLHPFFTAKDEPSLLSYCLGDEADETGTYGSMLEAQYASIGYALDALFPGHGLEVIVTETGWASGSSTFSGATPSNAQTYLANVLGAMQSTSSQIYEAKIFLFELFDEELKPGDDWEQHFGVYANDGTAKYSENALSLISGAASEPLFVFPESRAPNKNVWIIDLSSFSSVDVWAASLFVLLLVLSVCAMYQICHSSKRAAYAKVQTDEIVTDDDQVLNA